MTVVSTPACSSRMAAVWRRMWGVMFLLASDGQAGLRRAGVVGEAALERVAAERACRAGGEQRIAGVAPARSASQARRS